MMHDKFIIILQNIYIVGNNNTLFLTTCCVRPEDLLVLLRSSAGPEVTVIVRPLDQKLLLSFVHWTSLIFKMFVHRTSLSSWYLTKTGLSDLDLVAI